MVKRRKNRYRPLANPTHCARCGSTNLAIKNDAKPEIQKDGATPPFCCTDCRTRCHTAIVEEHQTRLDNTRQLGIMRGLSSTEDTRTERWLVTPDDIVRQSRFTPQHPWMDTPGDDLAPTPKQKPQRSENCPICKLSPLKGS